MIGGVIHNDIGVVVLLHNSVEGNNTWVGRSELVKGDFSNVDLALARGLMTRGDQALHGVGLRTRGVTSVDCTVDDAISAYAKNLDEFEGVSVNESPKGRVDGGGGGLHLRHDEGGGRDGLV